MTLHEAASVFLIIGAAALLAACEEKAQNAYYKYLGANNTLYACRAYDKEKKIASEVCNDLAKVVDELHIDWIKQRTKELINEAQ